MSLKNSSDTIGNRTGVLPACNAVPQPTAPPRAPIIKIYNVNIKIIITIKDIGLMQWIGLKTFHDA